MQVIFPTGRVVGGSLSKMFARTDNFGKPKIGADGKPQMHANFGFAIRKGAEAHWSATPWGASIFNIGKTAYPTEHLSPSFAWKVTDGDSTVPNKKGRKPCENETYRGHWVLWFSQNWLPTTCNADGSVPLPNESIKPGFFVRVMADVKSNSPSPSPGVYLNPSAVALIAEGDEIVLDVDLGAFSTAPVEALPVGARAVVAAVPGFAAPAPAPVAPVTAGVTAPPPPNMAFLQVPPKPARQMTAAAGGHTYEQMLAAGWTEAQLIQHGMMVV